MCVHARLCVCLCVCVRNSPSSRGGKKTASICEEMFDVGGALRYTNNQASLLACHPVINNKSDTTHITKRNFQIFITDKFKNSYSLFFFLQLMYFGWQHMNI